LTAAKSARVMPAGRVYTTTAGISSVGRKRADSFSTSVDSALPGSQDTASLFWALVSLPAGPKATASAISQSTRTAHFTRRSHGSQASRPTPAIR
jgi:hypothetical protein